MRIFPTTAEMLTIFRPVVADAAVQLGSLADLYSLQAVEQADATFEDVPSFALANAPIRLTMISAETVLTTFGEHPSIVFQGSMIRVIEVKEGDVFNVTVGDFIGQWFRVVKIVENQYADSYKLGLAESEAIV